MAKQISGIYKITNKVNGKVYIGQSVDIRGRWYHYKAYKNGKKYKEGCITYLERAFDKYGIENFSFEVILECHPDCLNLPEVFLICEYNSADENYGYNVQSGGKSAGPVDSRTREKLSKARHGKKHSPETKEKIGKGRFGKRQSPESRERMRQAKIGKKLSSETKEKMRQAKTGIKKSAETIEKIRISALSRREQMRQVALGKKHSPETKEKIRQIHIGKKLSSETKEKIRRGNIGKVVSQETREKLSRVAIGRKQSPETIAKRVESRRVTMALRREAKPQAQMA